MRRILLLTLALTLGLFIFSGCEMANNPMEVESTYSVSTELTKSSEDSNNHISAEVINSNSKGNLVIKFYHDGHTFELESMLINNNDVNIISNITNPALSTTLVVIEIPENLEPGIVTYEFNFIIDGEPIGITFDAEGGIGDAIASASAAATETLRPNQ